MEMRHALIALWLVPVMARTAESPDLKRLTPIPLPPWQALAVTPPGVPPAKSRFLRREETWELPDVVRIENRGQMIYHNYESDRIVEAAVIIGGDSDKIAAWDQFYEDNEERLTNLDGEIRYPDGRVIPLDRSVHLLEKLKRTEQRIDDRRGKNEEVELPPDVRLWRLVVPGAPPGTLIFYRAILHYDLLPTLTVGYADAPLPVDAYRLLIRSNRKLYVRKSGFFSFTGALNLSDTRKFEFNPRSGSGAGDAWAARAVALPRGTTLRQTRSERKGDVAEIEFAAENLPAFEREVMMPGYGRVRPLVAAMFSEYAPSSNLDYWHKTFGLKHRDAELVRFMRKRPADDVLDRAKIAGTGEPWEKVERIAAWTRTHFSELPDESFDEDETFASVVRKRGGNWAHRYYLFAALVREAGFEAEFASIFAAYELPVIPEFTDARFYRGPYLAVRVVANGTVAYFDPGEDETPGGRVHPWNWGGTAFHYPPGGGAVMERIPADQPRRNGERFAYTGALDPAGQLTGELRADFDGLTAARVRARLKSDTPLTIKLNESDLPRTEERIREARAAAGAQSSVSAEVYAKERMGGTPREIVASPNTGDKTSAAFSGRWTDAGFSGDGMPLLVSSLGLEAYFESATRRYAVVNLLPELHRFEFTITLPPGLRPAQPEFHDEITGPGGFHFKAEARFEGGVWKGAWELMEVTDEVAPADYPQLHDAERRALQRLSERVNLVAR